MATATHLLSRLGQSVWLDYIRKSLITSGGLARLVDDGHITGVTSNPSIFRKAIADSDDYASAIDALRLRGVRDPYEAFVAIAAEDIRLACAVLRPVWLRTGGADGFVSLELPPGMERDVEGSIAEAKRLAGLVGAPNLMIKVPGTPEGVAIMRELLVAGINVNVTLLFAVDAYEQFARGYVEALERRHEAGLPLDAVASVASFFVSRVDNKVDPALPEGSPLRGRAAVANARNAYARYLDVFSGPRWEQLAAAGARTQRPLWASTSTKNPAYSDVLYVEELIAADTVNTMPEPTLNAVLDHLDVRETIVPNLDDATQVLAGIAAAGIDLTSVTDDLLLEGLDAFEADFRALLDLLAAQMQQPSETHSSLGPIAGAVAARLEQMAAENIVARIWNGDHTVWKPAPDEITNRLGWLTVVDNLAAEAEQLQSLGRELYDEGMRHVLLLGMGGSSLAPEVLQETFGARTHGLSLLALDTTEPRQLIDTIEQVDLHRTMVIVSSKSGSTIETRSQLEYLWQRMPEGRHFIAITDPGSALATLGEERGFRRVFLNQSDIGGRYSALSYVGLVPAALCGIDVALLLARAAEMLRACDASHTPAENPGAWLGAVMGEAALAGRDKLTLVVPPALASFGWWVEQLVAESTGKEGRGILPVEGEHLAGPERYGDDRLFIAIGEQPELDALERAGHPVVRIPYADPWQLAAEFVRWEMVTAVAGSILAINPFDQPNVEAAKKAASRILHDGGTSPETPPLADVLATVRPGDYIAILAYLPRNAGTDALLQRARRQLQEQYRVATTVGFGPRYLHSTGQLHKGGPNTGVFIQVVGPALVDRAIPGADYSFQALVDAQAQGDLEALTEHGRRVARVSLDELPGLNDC